MQLNFLTPICSTGYGVAGVNLLSALTRGGHQVALFPRGVIDAPPEHHAAIQAGLSFQAFYNPWAPSVRLAQHTNLAKHVGRGPWCGFTIFELDRFSAAEVYHLRCLDRLFVCSQWARQVLIDHSLLADRVCVVPLGVDERVFSHEKVAPNEASPPETVFVNVGKFELRKGHDLLLDAFERAFGADDPVRLKVHGWNHLLGAGNRDWIERFRRSRLADKISIPEQPFASHHELARFMGDADCGVFPARAEGWNLELLEMMALGKTVIATNYSGHTEFVNEENCRLISISEVEDAHDGLAFRGQGRWARFGRPQMDELVNHLREVHRKKQSGQLLVNLAGIATARRFSWDYAASRLAAQVN